MMQPILPISWAHQTVCVFTQKLPELHRTVYIILRCCGHQEGSFDTVTCTSYSAAIVCNFSLTSCAAFSECVSMNHSRSVCPKVFYLGSQMQGRIQSNLYIWGGGGCESCMSDWTQEWFIPGNCCYARPRHSLLLRLLTSCWDASLCTLMSLLLHMIHALHWAMKELIALCPGLRW